MPQIIIMQGTSGSGKSFIVEALLLNFHSMGMDCESYSTDEYWYSMNGDDSSQYDFDVKKLAQAHEWNKWRVNDAMVKQVEVIIVDNTNTTQWEAQPYIDMAKHNGYDVRVVSVDCEEHIAKEANSRRPEKRQVPNFVIDKQRNKIERLQI